MKYGFIAKHRAQWPIRAMCRFLQVSASGFYDGTAAVRPNAVSTTTSSRD